MATIGIVLIFCTIKSGISREHEALDKNKIDHLDAAILSLRRDITSKEEAISEYDDRFERYEDLGNDGAANSELGKKQQAQRERDALKDLLLERQDQKIPNILMVQLSGGRRHIFFAC